MENTTVEREAVQRRVEANGRENRKLQKKYRTKIQREMKKQQKVLWEDKMEEESDDRRKNGKRIEEE